MTDAHSQAYSIKWVEDEFGIDPLDDNVDVIVQFMNGDQYVATFFTPQNVLSLLDRYQETGECAGGLYFWATNMIVITHLTKEHVARAVADLIESGEFSKAFEGPHQGESGQT